MENKNQTFLLECTEYQTELTENFIKRKKWETPNPKEVYSYIPGQILEIFVKKGQHVEAGSELLILEAMKMRNRIVAEISGKIKTIHVEIKQNIPKSHLMIEFE